MNMPPDLNAMLGECQDCITRIQFAAADNRLSDAVHEAERLKEVSGHIQKKLTGWANTAAATEQR